MTLYPTRPKSTLALIPSGRAGTDRTLAEMVRLARHWKKDAGIWKLSRQILRGTPANYRAEIARIFSWVKDNIRYTGDVRDVETLATPEATLEVRAGDCDDMAVLLASLLESVNHPTRFIALAFDNDAFSHVLTETRVGERWIALDPTVANATMGWKPINATQVMVKHV